MWSKDFRSDAFHGTRSRRRLPAGLALLLFLITASNVLALTPPSLVAAWGTNIYGQTNVPAGLTNAVAIAGGDYHSLALRSDGRVVAWGNNWNGQTNVPAGLTNAVAVAGGEYHSLAARSDGTVVAWGDNSFGQGNVPADLTNAVAVAGGYMHSLALRTNGSVVAWGTSNYGQTNVPAGLTDVVAVAAGEYHSLALRSDGSVAAWGTGTNDYGQTNVPAGLTNAAAVACGWSHSLALRSDGTVVAWGRNNYGQTNVPAGLTNAVAVAAGGFESVALRSDGTVVAWGKSQYDQVNVPTGLTNAVGIAAGYAHSLALTPAMDLTVTSAFGVPSPAQGTNWLIRGALQQCRVDPTGAVGWTQAVCLGWTGSGSVPGSGTSNEASFVITNHSTLTWLWQPTNYWLEVAGVGGGTMSATSGWYAIGSSVTVTGAPLPGYAFLAWSGDTNGCVISGAEIQVPLSQGRRIVAQFTAPALGYAPAQMTFSGLVYTAIADRSLTISNSGMGTLNYTVGSDRFWLSAEPETGSLAAGSSTTHTVRAGTRGLDVRDYTGHLTIADPVATNPPGTVAVQLNLGAVSLPSIVVGWGYGLDGQTNVPAGLTNVVAVAGGGSHSLALRADRSVVAWGNNGHGQTNVPAGLTNALAVAGGGGHSMVLRTDGSVLAWGENLDGQTNVPAGLTNVVAVAGGASHSLALRADGTAMAWGYNGNDVPAELTNALAVAAGYVHSLALRTDGGVVAWGYDTAGQLSVPEDLTNAVAVAAGFEHSLALRADGSVVAWGDNSRGQRNVPAGLTNVVAVAAGWFHSLALRADGGVAAWGDNTYDQVSVPAGLTSVVTVARGFYHALALAHYTEPMATNETPQWWLIAHGWTDNFDEAALDDVDRDGAATWEEYRADTDPTNPASVLSIVRIAKGPPRQVYFPCSSNRQYTLEFSDDLASGSWTNLLDQTDVRGTGGTNALSDTNVPGIPRCYRVRVELLP